LGVLLESEAVLVASDDEAAGTFASMLRAVVEARRHRYLMLNVAEASLPAICDLVAPRAPSVVPLAEPGLVAVHVLVPSEDVWRLLPQLEAAGGSSILILPVERMAA
jgi:ATP phosphoribosyltransferase